MHQPGDDLMNRRAVFCVIYCCLAWIAWAPVASAAGDFVILGERNAFWTNNRAAPVCKDLAKLQKQHMSQLNLSFPGRGRRSHVRQLRSR
jgi:hypothetical protein